MRGHDNSGRGLWSGRLTATAVALAAAQAIPLVPDVISRSKRILALVDDYHDNPTSDTRAALRHALMDEFKDPPASTIPKAGKPKRELQSLAGIEAAAKQLREGQSALRGTVFQKYSASMALAAGVLDSILANPETEGDASRSPAMRPGDGA